MFFVVFLLAAVGLLVADINGWLSVSYWLIGGVAAAPFILMFLFMVLAVLFAALAKWAGVDK